MADKTYNSFLSSVTEQGIGEVCFYSWDEVAKTLASMLTLEWKFLELFWKIKL